MKGTEDNDRLLVGLGNCNNVRISIHADLFRSALGAKHAGKLGTLPYQTGALLNVESQEISNNRCPEIGHSLCANKETDAATGDFSTSKASGCETAVPLQPSPGCGPGCLNIDRFCRLAG